VTRFGIELRPQTRVYAAFFLYSLCMGSLFPRLPDIQKAMGVAEGALGLALIGVSVGTLTSLTFSGPLVERIGNRATMLLGIPILSLLYACAMLAASPAVFFLLLVPVGLVIGAVEVVVNLEADRIEHAIGTRIMNRAHGFWSIGFFAAGLVGALAAQMGVSPQLHLFAMAPLVALGVIVLLGRIEAAPHRPMVEGETAPRFAKPTLAISILVGVTLSAMVMEGAGADWSAIFMRDVFGVEPFTAGFAVAVGAGAQAVTRFFADQFVERFSATLVARCLLTVLGVGVLMVFFAMSPAMALIGFALMGVGTSAIFPLAMSAAAQRTDRPAAINVASLAQTAFVAFLLGPPLLGFVAEHWGIRWSFGLGLPLVALSLVLAGALGDRQMKASLA